MTTGDQMVATGEWLNLAEASHRMGLSIQTLRRRIKKGKIQSRQVDNPFGKSYEVWVDQDYTPEPEGIDKSTPEDSSGVDRDSQDDEASTNLELIRLVESLHRENRELAEASTVWQARAGMLLDQLTHTQAQLGEARQTIKMLEAPKIEEVKPEESQEQEQTSSWWRSWWHRLVSE